MDPLLAPFLGGIIGALISGVTTVFILSRQNEFTQQAENRLREEEKRRALASGLRQHYLEKIEQIGKYVSERRALLLLLGGKVYEAPTVMFNLYKELWLTASLAELAAQTAASFGDQVTSDLILKVENEFWQFWKLKKNSGPEKEIDKLETSNKNAFELITLRVFDYRQNLERIVLLEINKLNGTAITGLIGQQRK